MLKFLFPIPKSVNVLGNRVFSRVIELNEATKVGPQLNMTCVFLRRDVETDTQKGEGIVTIKTASRSQCSQYLGDNKFLFKLSNLPLCKAALKN
jgi:hypothetical protein